jgi:hypothetical protein
MSSNLINLYSVLSIFIYSILTTYFYYLVGNSFKFNFNNENNTREIIYKSIFGLIIVSFIALFLNFFFSLNKMLNGIVYLSLFIIIIFKKKSYISKRIFGLLILSGITCFFLIIFSNVYVPDAGLYHLPFINIINDQKIIIGLNNIHSRFGHISIIQYLSAINYNLIFELNGILIPPAVLYSLIIIHFGNEIIIFVKKKRSTDLNDFYSLFIFIFISLKINRYSEFGNDATAHLLFFYIISLFLIKKKNEIQKFNDYLLIAIYIFLNKIFLIFSFFIPIIIFLKNPKKNIFNKKFFFSSLFLILWTSKNILNTGCLIYPIDKTCIKNLSYYDELETINQKISGEAWAKAWPENKNTNITQKDFIKNFKWLESWSHKHMKYIFNKLIIYIFILILISIYFYKIKIKISSKKNYKIIALTFISFLGIIFWFLKAPIYRYGYSYLVIFLFSVLYLTFYKKFEYNLYKTKKVFIKILTISFILLIFIQIPRIVKNFNSNQYWPNIFLKNNNNEIAYPYPYIKSDLINIYYNNGECWYSMSPCTNYDLANTYVKKINFLYNLSYTLIFKK